MLTFPDNRQVQVIIGFSGVDVVVLTTVDMISARDVS